jgi:4-amino-4-deoxy-L-arabinose transferase-like glycosyltransferase
VAITSISPKGRLALLLGLYLILAISYSVVVPIGRGADEWAHYWYAQFIAQHGRLPANPAEREAAGYKSDWPPLYHLITAGLTGWAETAGPPTFKYRQNNIRRQLIPSQGSEAILHTEDELFPWQQEILVWHLGRFLSIAFSLTTLVITYFIALEVFSNLQSPISNYPPSLALIAVAILAFNPRFLFTGMLFNYDSLTLLLASLFLWLVIRVAEGYYPKRGFFGLGALTGLALLTKYLAALLPSMIVFAALVLMTKASEAGKTAQRKFLITDYALRITPHLRQAALAFLFVITWWFGYLLFNFNEIETYGPLLGTLAPLLRGDGSDRTVEELFAFLGGGQIDQPVYIDKPSRTTWQIMAELPLTFWGNPISRPYPLTWFVSLMTGVTIAAMVGLVITWRRATLAGASSQTKTIPSLSPRQILGLLLLYCLLPVPFMVIRLFGARDPLEAVQGRHILFLAGPAVAILITWGSYQLSIINYQLSIIKLRITHYALRFTFYILLSLLLTGAIAQLIFMQQTYPPPLPVRTTTYLAKPRKTVAQSVTLEGGAQLIDYHISLTEAGEALQVTLIWQGGANPVPEDYQMELALVDRQGETLAGWRAYQTQARYPTRAWEADDIIHDEGWLPLAGLPAGDYEIRLRLLGEKEAAVDWQRLDDYTVAQMIPQPAHSSDWLLWRQGQVVSPPPLLHERETAQFTFAGAAGQLVAKTSAMTREAAGNSFRLVGPDGLPRLPLSTGPRWANFVIDPTWPAGDYYAEGDQQNLLFRVAASQRNFQTPEIKQPLEANFEGKIKLLGYDLPSRRVKAGEGLPITLYWQGLTWMGEEFVIFNRLLDNQQIAWGGYDRLAQENYNTLLWAPNEIIVDGFAIPVAPDTPDGVYTLNLGWYRKTDGQARSLPVLKPEMGEPTEVTAVIIGPIKVGGPPPDATVKQAHPQTELNIILGEEVKLLGFDLTAESLSEVGSEAICSTDSPLHLPCSFRLVFYWQVLTPPAIDYTVFAHIRNNAGDIVTQKDTPPLNGVYPTSLWDTDEIIKDKLNIPLEQLESGQYELIVGMYDFKTGTRLPIADSPDGTILLQSFEVSIE